MRSVYNCKTLMISHEPRCLAKHRDHISVITPNVSVSEYNVGVTLCTGVHDPRFYVDGESD